MATYKVWLTVKDSNGSTKEIDGGTINVNLSELSKDEVNIIGEALPLEEYLRKDEAVTELDPSFATEAELADATRNTIKYADFELQPEEGGNG